MSQNPYDYSTRKGIQPISWEHFHGICKALALSVLQFQPEAILPIGRGGFYPGTLLAHLLQTEVYPVRVSRRVRDVVTYQEPQWLTPPPAEIAGRRVLIVDEICDSGETLLMVKEKALALGASLCGMFLTRGRPIPFKVILPAGREDPVSAPLTGEEADYLVRFGA